MPLVIDALDNDIDTLTLANDAKRNALSEELLDELVNGLARMKGKSARAVILTTRKGSRVWSAGHDVSELPPVGHDPLTFDEPLEKAIRAIQAFPAPVIAALEGSVWGGACELVLACDIRVGTAETTFAITPVKLGVPYNLNGLLNLVGAIGLSAARYMLLTAQPLPAARAYQLGLLHELVGTDELDSTVEKLARGITAHSGLAISVIKEQLRLLARAHPLSPDSFEQIQALRRIVYESADYRAGVEAFLRKRAPAKPET